MNSSDKQKRTPVPESDQSGKASSRIPEFASREEEADFWDTHDFTDFLDDAEPVKIIYGGSIYGPIDQIIAFRLAPDEEQELKRMADEAGESVSSLALRLVSEQIRKKTA